jgi:hypothetical protein
MRELGGGGAFEAGDPTCHLSAPWANWVYMTPKSKWSAQAPLLGSPASGGEPPRCSEHERPGTAGCAETMSSCGWERVGMRRREWKPGRRCGWEQMGMRRRRGWEQRGSKGRQLGGAERKGSDFGWGEQKASKQIETQAMNRHVAATPHVPSKQK